MFEQKLIDFLLENNIDIDLVIDKDKKENRKLEQLIYCCKLINVKTLSSYHDLSFKKNKGKIVLYFISMRIRLSFCIRKDKLFMSYSNCSECNLSTQLLCALNAVYKTNGIIIKESK